MSSSSSSEKPLSLKVIKESYLLTASEIKALTKPYRLENVKHAAIKKFGSEAKLQEAISNRNAEREEKKNKKKKKDEQRLANRKSAEETLINKLKSFNVDSNNVVVKEENIKWLIHTNVGQQCIDQLVSLEIPGDDTNLDENAVRTLLNFNQKANERFSSITQAIKQRLVQAERQKLNERWIEYDVNVIVPPGSRLGIGAMLGPMMSPPGLLVKSFLNVNSVSPRGGGGGGPRFATAGNNANINAANVVGPLESSKLLVSSRVLKGIEKVMPGDIIVAINNNRIAQNTIPMAMMTLTMVSQMSMMNNKPQMILLRLSRFKPASKELLLKAQETALEPNRLSTFLNSPFIMQYAQATQPRKGEEVAYWLLNQNSVISEIFAPFERLEVLEQLFLKHKLTLKGPNGLLEKQFDETNVKQMYDMYTISSILKKYMDAGEVGRGRNKTSLKTAKQVVTAVVTHMKASKVYQESQQSDLDDGGNNKKKRKRNS